MIGQKGIPATYGGVERHVEELAVRLVERGHEVTVYRRPYYDRRRARRPQPFHRPAYYHGVRLVRMPSLRHEAPGCDQPFGAVHASRCGEPCGHRALPRRRPSPALWDTAPLRSEDRRHGPRAGCDEAEVGPLGQTRVALR